VWTEVESPDHVEGDLAVKPEALKPDRGDLVAALIEGTNLCSASAIGINRRGREIGGAQLTDCAVVEAILCRGEEDKGAVAPPCCPSLFEYS